MKYLVLAVLLAAVAHSFLTPPYLPTAFTEQYYEARYRVRGMPHAEFTFTNLPDWLSGSKDGIISGTPDVTGTFRFNVAYSNGEEEGSEEVVLSVTMSPNTARSAQQNEEVVELIVTTALNSWIYRVNDQINVQLGSQGGKAPITWNYINLPHGLYGDIHGNIRGSVKEAGLYSFSAECGDSAGQKASSYYTLNIQPGTLIRSNFLFIQPIMSLMSLIEMEELSMILTRLLPNRLLLMRLSSELLLLLNRTELSPRLNRVPRLRPSLLLTLLSSKKLLLRLPS